MTAVAGGLITLEYALEGLNYGAKQEAPEGEALSARDAEVARYIKAATPVIEYLAGTPILPRTQTQRRDGGKSAVLIAGHIASEEAVTAVRVDGDDFTGFTVDPDAGIVYAGRGLTFTAGTRNVEIDITTGYSPTPEDLALAARELVVAMAQGGNIPIPGFDPTGGSATSTAPDEQLIPRAVRQLCISWRTGGFA